MGKIDQNVCFELNPHQQEIMKPIETNWDFKLRIETWIMVIEPAKEWRWPARMEIFEVGMSSK